MAKSYVGAPPGELAPPPRVNPGSATDVYFEENDRPFRFFQAGKK